MVAKGEYQVIQGRINDLAWDADSQRIIAVGDGKEKYGHCFTADSGNTVGSIAGHSAVVNAVSIRPVRPYRAVTVGDDARLVFYQGPPFQFSLSHQDKHTNFVQDAQFSPNGEFIVSVGSDRKIALYEGKTGEFLSFVEDESNGHKGSIFSVAWSPDSSKFATASADQTVKLWSVADKKVLKTWSFPAGLENHQVGVVFAGEYIISLSYSGDLNYLQESSDKPVKTVTGHQKTITSLASSGPSKPLVSGSYDGKIVHWDASDITASSSVHSHDGPVVGIVSDGEHLWSVGWDDTLKRVGSDSSVSLFGQPKAVASGSDGIIAVVGESYIQVFDNGKQLAFNTSLEFPAQAVSVSKSLVAVGSSDNSIHLFNRDLSVSNSVKLAPLRSAVTYLAFSPDGEYLAAGDASGKITLYSIPDQSVVTGRWAFHTSRVTSIHWHPSGSHVVAGSADTNIIIYSVANPGKNIKYLGAHKDGINSVLWTSDSTFASAGNDATVKRWRVTL
ncbi:Aip1p [Sugiyamaella lignohabitans]|uniref:Aip1p n=1 Tax=Sugiyamaella lignohabitans TaxID=796027 RepID=A0A167EB98_9ASCO|nr:Aip1p [Sugiyamaella lignohabitans]ANB13864.1 Aip1p [Sugiyamaella lignohabitans]